MKTNIIYNEDCIEGTNRLSNESIDLIYIDPPFNSGKDYKSYNDKWNGMESYIDWMRPRVEELYRVLKSTGSFYLHCDWHANAHLRIMLDGIFGDKNFRNEIIWNRNRAFKRSSARRFPHKHDTIFFYCKDLARITFNPQYRLHKPEYIKRFKKDAEGRLYRDDVKRKRMYLDEVEGDVVESIWYDVLPLNSATKERLGYPNQKPEALLERIIKASSNKGDIILDAFCGCGTTLAVAQKLGREWIGIDISPIAVKLAKIRLKGQVDERRKNRRNIKPI